MVERYDSKMQRCENVNYFQAIDILTSQGKFYINLGLERVQKILELMDNPQKKLQFIHVAGTNGKGSVCSMLSSIMVAKNIKTGMFTSPHIFEYTERIRINDVEIDKDVFAQRVLEVVNLAKKNEVHLTEFEILTVIAFDYFSQNGVEIVVLETGLGGRLDATNVIEKNICSVITHLDLDHTERLGDTIEKIAYEKAGIIKENCPVIVAENNAGIDIIKKVAKEKNSEVFFDSKASKFFDNLSLKGIYQKENLSLALSVVNILNNIEFGITENEIVQGLKEVKHPCRFEKIESENIIIEGAHNPDGIKALRSSLDYYYPNQKFKFIFGCLKNKNYKQMMENLFTSKDEIYFYHFNSENSSTIEELSKSCNFYSKPFHCYKKDADTLTVICGSFYMIKELLTKIGLK